MIDVCGRKQFAKVVQILKTGCCKNEELAYTRKRKGASS